MRIYRHRHTTLRRLVPAFLLAVLVVAAAPIPLQADSEAVFAFSGRGWGHGIGMSQYGAKGFAQAGYTYDAILGHYFTGTTMGSIPTDQVMRVAIQRTNAARSVWSMRAPYGNLLVYSGKTLRATLSQNVVYSFRASGTNIAITDPGGTPVGTFAGPLRMQDSTGRTSRVEVSQPSGPWDWSNVIYRGSVQLHVSGTGLKAYNFAYMEDYLKSVVPYEMPASWPSEALKSQAVAARSYAFTSLTPSRDWDVYCTTSSQVYAGYGHWTAGGTVVHEDSRSDAAISGTADQAVTYEGSPVKTFFHSTSGGHTENIENVWPGTGTPSTSYPYYSGVSDPYEASAGSPYHVWPDEPEYSASTLRALLHADGLPVPGEIVGIDVTARGVSGRVTELWLRGASADDKRITDIYGFRSALGLRDTWFEVWGNTRRIYGADRYSTSVEISLRTFTDTDAVVIANGAAFADALSASALAGSVPGGAPILLTTRDAVPTSVVGEVQRLTPETIYIIGGTGVVSEGVEQLLGGIATVVRLAGVDRFATGKAVIEEIAVLDPSTVGGRVIVVNAFGAPDAVVSSPLAYSRGLPVVMVRTDSVPVASAEALEVLSPVQALIVGGSGVVGDGAISALGIPAVRVAAGVDRYDTAAKLAQYATGSEGLAWTTTTIASGQTLVDALSGGPFAGESGGPMLLTRKGGVPIQTSAILGTHSSLIDKCYLLGGSGAIDEEAQRQLEEALQ